MLASEASLDCIFLSFRLPYEIGSLKSAITQLSENHLSVKQSSGSRQAVVRQSSGNGKNIEIGVLREDFKNQLTSIAQWFDLESMEVRYPTLIEPSRWYPSNKASPVGGNKSITIQFFLKWWKQERKIIKWSIWYFHINGIASELYSWGPPKLKNE